ncbi:Protein of unknown function [Cotesia congregata]|uniref:Uncharacterized protein n=1 Tax=Cotesia congregata TaxID=51543 RepID=A0A8J2HAE4_COTCN|nr:Protein of unknown function [Cotesia congregata]
MLMTAFVIDLNVMYRLGNSVSSYSKNLIYKSIIAPYIDYCSSIMINYSARDLDKLQNIQNRAMRLVLGVNRILMELVPYLCKSVTCQPLPSNHRPIALLGRSMSRLSNSDPVY